MLGPFISLNQAHKPLKQQSLQNCWFWCLPQQMRLSVNTSCQQLWTTILFFNEVSKVGPKINNLESF